MNSSSFLEIHPNALEIIAKTWQKSEKSIKEDVATLKTWMATQPHLPEILNDNPIQNMLIAHKCSVEKAKQTIDNYYTLRFQIFDCFKKMNTKRANMTQMMECVFLVPLPKLTPEMYRVIFWKVRARNGLDDIEPSDVFKFAFCLDEIRLNEDVLCGDIVVVDWHGFSFGSLIKWAPVALNNVFTEYQKIFSVVVKKIYFINCPPFINIVSEILKKLLKPKIFNRIHVSKDISILADKFEKENLPKDYGGEEKSLEELQITMKEKFLQYADRFKEIENFKINESLRPQKLKNDEILGFQGNFKQLDFD